MLKNSEFA